MRAGAAPRPIERARDEAGCDGVERQIAGCGDELPIVGDLARHRMSAKEVRAATVAAVVPTRVLTVQPLQRKGKPGIANPNQRVVVAPHQDVRDESKLEALADCGEAVEEIVAVGIDDKEKALVTPASGEMVDPGVERTQGTGHTCEARSLVAGAESLVPVSARIGQQIDAFSACQKPVSDTGLAVGLCSATQRTAQGNSCACGASG